MRPEARKLLTDALEAAEAIQRFVSGFDFEAYRTNELVRSAVERRFEIIGEAMANLRKGDAAVARRIPDVDRIVAFRNVLIHRYVEVDERLVWSVVEAKLPALHAAIEGLLAER